jgi:hypothetical protein
MLGESEIQVVFERTRPLRDGVVPVALYPAILAAAQEQKP